MLLPCGHSGNRKAAKAYQRGSILLARNGLAALCYDPIDPGERFQLLNKGWKPIEGGTTAHSMLGVGSALQGRNTATLRVWDGLRAIDYLQGRPEIDTERIGCTGNSGGGTLTSYLAMSEAGVRLLPERFHRTIGQPSIPLHEPANRSPHATGQAVPMACSFTNREHDPSFRIDVEFHEAVRLVSASHDRVNLSRAVIRLSSSPVHSPPFSTTRRRGMGRSGREGPRTRGGDPHRTTVDR